MKRGAFTLVELLVVIAIVGLLSTIAIVSLGTSRMNTRNAMRKANLVQISKALELYHATNDAYPATAPSAWYGACTNPGLGPYPDTDPGSWIPGLTSGGYIATLPRDPNTNKTNPSSGGEGCRINTGDNCYLYRSDGINYKLLSFCTPEGTLSSSDPFYDPYGGRGSYAWQISTPGGLTW